MRFRLRFRSRRAKPERQCGCWLNRFIGYTGYMGYMGYMG